MRKILAAAGVAVLLSGAAFAADNNPQPPVPLQNEVAVHDPEVRQLLLKMYALQAQQYQMQAELLQALQLREANSVNR
jgi:opacity protein-like surface antigen